MHSVHLQVGKDEERKDGELALVAAFFDFQRTTY